MKVYKSFFSASAKIIIKIYKQQKEEEQQQRLRERAAQIRIAVHSIPTRTRALAFDFEKCFDPKTTDSSNNSNE